MTHSGTCIGRDGTSLAYFETGSGRPIIALHGFPDTYETWNGLTGPLVGAGARFIAAAMRGYMPSDVPGSGDYSVLQFANDIICLLDALEIERATVLGHDWGASAGYALAALAPERLECLVTLAIPPFSVFPTGLRERLARPHNFYLGFGPLSNWWLRRGDFEEVRRLYRKWSPRWDTPKDHMEKVIAALRQAGRSRAAVDYYRARMSDEDRCLIVKSIETPVLMIYGSDEPHVRRESYARAAQVTGAGSRIVRIDGAGHWPHLEAPERCLAEILPFLASHHGPD